MTKQVFIEAAAKLVESWDSRFDGPPPPNGYVPTTTEDEYPDLHAHLLGLRMLDRVPLSYLVPDAQLLPPESVRFFFVDPVFTDRLVEGALAAATVGTPDQLILDWAQRLSVVYGATEPTFLPQGQPLMTSVVAYLREWLDVAVKEEIAPDGASPKLLPYQLPPRLQLTGLIMRSSIVRRWPQLRVAAYKTADAQTPLAVSRPFRHNASTLMVLIAGLPAVVDIIEPDEGVRFGVEQVNGGNFNIKVDPAPGSPAPSPLQTIGGRFRDPADRVIDMEHLAKAMASAPGSSVGSGHLSLGLEQRPYAQRFRPTTAWSEARLTELDTWAGAAAAAAETLRRGES